MGETTQELQQIYRNRFTRTSAYRQRRSGRCSRRFFSTAGFRIPPRFWIWVVAMGNSSTTSRPAKKYAMDLNPDARQHLASGAYSF